MPEHYFSSGGYSAIYSLAIFITKTLLLEVSCCVHPPITKISYLLI